MLADALRNAMRDLDVDAVVALVAQHSPHLPAPASRADALVALHIARTEAQSMPEPARLYSHRWLTERGYQSLLPDDLRPKAERIYPRTVTSVGIACLASVPPEIAVPTVRVMSNAACEVYADAKGEPDQALVKRQMLAARARERRGLGLPASGGIDG